MNFFLNRLTFLILIFAFSMRAQQYPGYTLYSTKNSTNAYLIDTNGTNYHSWTITGKPTCYSTYLMPGGYLWRTVTKTGNSFTGGPISGEFQKLDYNGNVLWDFVYSTTSYCTHHDICPMPNGNVLLIAYETKSATEVAAAGCSTFANIMWPDKIVEVQQTGPTTGNVVWEWHVWDHLVQNSNPSAANYQASIVNHPELLNINFNAQKDWLHVNGVHYNPVLDQVTFSSHNLNEIYVIDHSTTTTEAASHSGGNSGKGGDILYRWGNPLAYGAAGTQIFKVVHDAHWVPEGCPNAGDLTGYNNQGISTTASCADIFTPPLNGYNYTINLGSAFGPATYNIRQASGGYNSNEGSAYQLPNGNILLNMGISGYIKEFSPNGTLLWTKTLTAGNAKATRYSDCFIVNQPPPIPVITQNGSTLTSTAAADYQWYLNGQAIPGATSQTYSPTQSGIYLVKTTDSNFCVYEYSLGFNFVLTTGIKKNQDVKFEIYPNPSNGLVYIQDEIASGERFEVFVYDVNGKLILKNKTIYQLNLREFGSGIYQVTIVPEHAPALSRKIVITE